MDGVLIDSEPVYQEYEKSIYRKYGIPITQDLLTRALGRQMIEWWEEIKETYHLDQMDPEEITKEEILYYKDFVNSERAKERMMPHITDLIRILHEKGYKMALATGSVLEEAKVVLNMADPDGCVDVALSSESVAHGKPAPDIFLEAARLLQVDPEDCLVVEDSDQGMLAAKRAGMTVVGYQPNPEIQAPHAEFRITDHLDLLDLPFFIK